MVADAMELLRTEKTICLDRSDLWEELPKVTDACPRGGTIEWEELPRSTREVTRGASDKETVMRKDMFSSVSPSSPAAITPSPTSMMDITEGMKTMSETNDQTSVCSTAGSLTEYLTTMKQTNECTTNRHPTFERKTKPSDEDIVGQMFGGPCYGKSKTEYRQSAFLETCPRTTNILGLPSTLTITEKNWLTDQIHLVRKQSVRKEVLLGYTSTDVNTNRMFSLKQTCPTDARNPGFPSVPQHGFVRDGSRMVNISPCCPIVSNLSGTPSIREAKNTTWISQQEGVFEHRGKTHVTLMTMSPKTVSDVEHMGSLVPTCPKHSRITGLPSGSQCTVPVDGSWMMSLFSSCPETSHVEGIPSLVNNGNKNWTKDKLSTTETWDKVNTVVIEDAPHTEVSVVSLLAPTCPKKACIPGLPSALTPGLHNSLSWVNLLPSCPAVSSVDGFPSMWKVYSSNGNTVQLHHPLLKRDSKNRPIFLLENKIHSGMEQMVSSVQTCPKESNIHGFPFAPQPVHDSDKMVRLSNSCSKITGIPGIPSFHKPKEWTISSELLCQPRTKEDKPLVDICDKEKTKMKSMVFLSPSCPEVAQTPGFPCHPNPPAGNTSLNITSLFTLCPQVSRIPGFPAADVKLDVEWETEKASLVTSLPKKELLFDTSSHYKNTTKNMVSCVPSCPKAALVSGFPSNPHPKLVYYSLNVVNLHPLCPLVSTIPGFSSVEGQKVQQWTTELSSWIPRPQKYIKPVINCSPVQINKANNMSALVSSCPRASKVPGFPSALPYNMIYILPVCSTVSSFSGCASCATDNRLRWLSESESQSLHEKHSKDPVLLTADRNIAQDSVQPMWPLAPSCPEVSRTPGFPSAPQSKSKFEPNMISLLPCCTSASSISGFASIATIISRWINDTQPVLIRPVRNNSELMKELVGEHLMNRCNITSMVTHLKSCPQKARVWGFPSAPVVDKPPNMVSSYTSAPCVSCVQGFPSARMLSFERTEIQNAPKHRSLFDRQQKEKICLMEIRSAKDQHEHDRLKDMVAMATCCPHLAQTPGFPSNLQWNVMGIETQPIPSPSACREDTSQRMSPDQSTQPDLTEERQSGGSCSHVLSHGTSVTRGETFIVFKSRSAPPCFVCLSFALFTVFVTEEHFEAGESKNLDISVDKG